MLNLGPIGNMGIMMPMAAVAGGGGASYTTTGKRIDGAAGNYYKLTTNLYSTDRASFTMCMFFRIPLNYSSDQYIFNISSARLEMRTQSVWDNTSTKNQLRFYFQRYSGSVAWLGNNITLATHGIMANTWFPLLYSYQNGTGQALYVGDTLLTPDSSAYSSDLFVNQNPSVIGGTYYYSGAEGYDISHVLMTDQYMDITQQANRAKFYDTSTLKPVDMGADGSTPFGSQPEYFFPDGDFTNNLGSAGNFTEVGTVANSSTSPTD